VGENAVMRAVRTPTIEDLDAAAEVVSRHLPPTPVVPSPGLGPGVVLKLETLLPTGAFKVRGALVAVAAALAADPDRQIVTASAGNHGLGVAFAAERLGARATVVVPETASPVKVAALRRFPVEVVEHGQNYDAAEAWALGLATGGACYVSPYNDAHVIAGQGTILVELAQQVPGLATVVTPVGGGGLASGLGLAASRTGVRVVGVEAEQSPAMLAALEAGGPVPIEIGPTLADGLAGNLEAGSVTFDLVRRHVADVIAVSEREIAAAIRHLVAHHGVVAEGSAAVGVAALLHGRLDPGTGPTAVVVTGRNIDRAALVRVLEGG
jgi:threonine dehydratase